MELNCKPSIAKLIDRALLQVKIV